MFLIVIASILFSWQEAYEMYYLQCLEDEAMGQSTNTVMLTSVISLDHQSMRISTNNKTDQMFLQ